MTKTTIVATSMNRSGEKRAPIRHACKTHRRSTSRAPPRHVAVSSAERHPAVSLFRRPSATPRAVPSAERHPAAVPPAERHPAAPLFHQSNTTPPGRCSIIRAPPRATLRHPAFNDPVAYSGHAKAAATATHQTPQTHQYLITDP